MCTVALVPQNTLLTNLPLDKMVAILADDISEWISWNEMKISIRMSINFVPKNPIDNKSAFVQVMAWCRTGDKQLPEVILNHFTDEYMCH